MADTATKIPRIDSDTPCKIAYPKRRETMYQSFDYNLNKIWLLFLKIKNNKGFIRSKNNQ